MHRTLRLTSLASTLVALTACGDDGGRVTTDETTGVTGGLSGTTGDTAPTTGGQQTTNPSSDPTVTSGVTEGVTSGPVETGTTTDATTLTTTTDATTLTTTTDATTLTTTTDTTTTTTDGQTTGGTTQGCACSPGEVGGCENGQQLVCGADCQGFEATPCPNGQTCNGNQCTALFCVPGEKVCEGEVAVKTCNGQGEAFDPPVNCGDTEGCSGGACVSLCLIAEAQPSSVGCSFFAQRMDNYDNNSNDSLIVGNTSKTKTATAQLYFTPNGTNVEQPQGAAVVIPPGKTQTYPLSNAPFNKTSGLRKGGSYRVQTNVPVVAYQHSPIGSQATNDASMLLPEHALKQDYVVASYKDGLNNYPSYFNVIAAVDGTTVKWTPPQATLAGGGVPAVAANTTGQVTMNRFDSMEVRVANGGDISGTIISSDKPIWVIGAVNCVNVPNNITYCDHIEEQMLPLDYWGKKYVGAHSPKRGTEKHYWRVYGGEENTTISTNPPQPGTPFVLGKGQWKELVIPNSTSFIFEGDKPFLPVQYLEGTDGGAGTGDPAMYQMIPVEQFLERYAFATGTGYTTHYAQIIRLKSNPDVLVDGAVVGGYYAVGDYEVADYKISEGAHLAESDAPFGIINVGYTNVTSYAYPGGLRLEVINPQ
jgi:hypothetical protein